jgi:hypothetical protein
VSKYGCICGNNGFYADGSIKTVYTNHDGQILLTEEAASSSYYAEKVINHYVYDAQGNQIQHNTPEVISSYTLYGGYILVAL